LQEFEAGIIIFTESPLAEVFISYRHVRPDQVLAAELAKHLAAHRISYFVDSQLRIGDKWIKVIERELQACQSLVVLLSSESIRSDMVRHEVKLAHGWSKRILPVRVGYDGALPYDLGAYLDPIQYELWRPGEPFDTICGAIVDGIRGRWTHNEIELSPEAIRRLGEATEGQGAPLPCADPRLETGALKLDSPFYARRAADEQAERLVRQPGETILIKGPRQVGKTSLAARAQAHAESNGQRTCYIDFQSIDEKRLRDSSTLLPYLAARMARDFRTTVKPSDVWDETLGDTDSFTDFLQQAVLATADAPVVVCLDEVDSVFKYPYRDNFFGMLRGWHNRRARDPIWNRFNLLIVHSTEPALFIRDLNQSPFNVGTILRVADFNRDELRLLNARHGSPLKSAEELERLIRLVGGHPYLVRQALYTLFQDKLTIGYLERTAADDRGPFSDHLRRLLWSLRDNVHLRKSLKRVLTGRGCESEDDFQRLRASGVIAGESRQTARLRCDLYAIYLREHL
jgi:hypothetical protein